MGFFGKNDFVVGSGAYSVIERCSDAAGIVITNQLREAVQRAEVDLYDPWYAENRGVHGAGMRVKRDIKLD